MHYCLSRQKQTASEFHNLDLTENIIMKKRGTHSIHAFDHHSVMSNKIMQHLICDKDSYPFQDLCCNLFPVDDSFYVMKYHQVYQYQVYCVHRTKSIKKQNKTYYAIWHKRHFAYYIQAKQGSIFFLPFLLLTRILYVILIAWQVRTI